jgi:hypothetical protein
MRILLVALAALVATGRASEAQPFRSDDVGPTITGSGVAGGSYPGAGFRNLEDVLFRRVGDATAFRSAAIADAVLGAAAGLGEALCSSVLPPPREWPDGPVFDSLAQQRICAVVRDSLDEVAAGALLRALTGGIDGPHVARARELTAGLRGLVLRERAYADPRRRWVEAGAWQRALRSYEAYLSSAPAPLLDPPPAELVVVGSLLQRVVSAGLDATAR